MNTDLRTFAFCAVAMSLMSGCASHLKVHNADQTREVAGVPVLTPTLVKITETVRYIALPGAEKYNGLCTEQTTSRYAVMPLGERIYVNFDAAAFGKGEFKLEFNDAGGLRVVSLNSDAAAGIEQATGLLGTILPFLSTPKTAATEAATASLAQETGVADKRDNADALKAKFCATAGTTVNDIEFQAIR